jgi:tyrosyl-tRNA synthetase
MLGRESVRTRLESPQGLSFTEFSYSLLQALDFKVLRARHDCRLQVGGSDQWGNIVAGVELIRRTMGLDAHGLTWPLLTKADGEKFGKSAGDNIWLNAELTSTWAFWQFWLNQTDDDAATLLRLLSWRSVADVDAVLARHGEAPSRRHAQRALADEMTEWVHGLHSLASVHSAVEVLFGSRPGGLDAEVISVLADQIPTVRLSVNELSALDLPGLLVRLGAADTRAGASRLLASGGIAVNSQVAPDKASRPLKLVENGALLVRRGKRSHFLAIVEAPCERRCHTDARAAARPQPAGSPTVDDGKQR